MVSSKATIVAAYHHELVPERRAEIAAVRDLVNAALPTGYREGMGKSCIRFKRADDLALGLIGAEIASTTPEQYIEFYERVKPPSR